MVMERRFEVRVQLSEYWFAFLFLPGDWTVWVSWFAFGRFLFTCERILVWAAFLLRVSISAGCGCGCKIRLNIPPSLLCVIPAKGRLVSSYHAMRTSGEDLKSFNFECMEDRYSSIRYLKVCTRAQLEFHKLSGDLHGEWDKENYKSPPKQGSLDKPTTFCESAAKIKIERASRPHTLALQKRIYSN